MSTYRIQGGKRLSGSIEVLSGKNAPIALIVASLLTRGVVRFSGITKVEEVLRVLEVLESIGVGVRWIAPDILEVDTSRPLSMARINKEVCAKVRISLLLFGALATREKSYRLYRSGGCHLGERTIRPHVHSLKKLGVSVTSHGEYYHVETKRLRAAHVVMYESSDTATENVIMAAVLAKGTTTITFASANYMVQDLCYFLRECGAKISGIGTTSLTIEGVAELAASPTKPYHPMPDPVDAFAWISLAIATRSELTVIGCPIDFLELELEYLSMMGQKIKKSRPRFSESGFFRLVDIALSPSRLKALPDKLHPRPYPGLNVDCVPLFLPILTQAEGRTLVHDWIYENRAVYALDLKKLGANVTLLDPHRLIIEGSTALTGNEVACPPALRPGMSLLIAMLAAKGPSLLTGAYPIERGYSDLVQRLQKLGANIERVS